MVTLRLTDEEYEALKARAVAQGRSMENLIRRLLADAELLFQDRWRAVNPPWLSVAKLSTPGTPTRAEIAEVFQVEEKWLRDPAPGTLIAKRIRDEKGKRL